jgi:hypothetical protein
MRSDSAANSVENRFDFDGQHRRVGRIAAAMGRDTIANAEDDIFVRGCTR